MRNLIIDEVRSFRNLVRQHAIPAQNPNRKDSHELPPAPPRPEEPQPGAGMGPAYGGEVVGAENDHGEDPSSALERQLDQKGVA